MGNANLNAEPVELAEMRRLMPTEHQMAFDILVHCYGDNTESLINGLMDMTVRAAILGGVTAETFGEGMKQHWDYYAAEISKKSN